MTNQKQNTQFPIAVMSICSGFGIGILEIVHGIDDYLTFKFIGGRSSRTYARKIEYDGNGEPYFRAMQQALYLKDFQKV